MVTQTHSINRAPSGRSSDTVALAPAPQVSTKQPDELQIRDLVAQEVMADTAVWMAAAAILTLLITSLGTLLIWRQVRLTREAVEETSKATDAMRDANKIAREASERQLRAYITCEETMIDFGNLLVPNEMEIEFQMRNAGQTPAYEVSNVSRLEYGEADPDAHRMIFRGKPGGKPTYTVISPGGATHHRSVHKIPPGFFKAVLQGQMTIVLAVIISYRDAFGRRRLTTGRYNFDPKVMAGRKGPYAMRICAKGTAAN